MKCGDIVRNHYAGENNPTRFFVYIQNEGRCSKVIYFDGKRLRFSHYYSNDLKTDKFEIVDHLPIVESIKNILDKHLKEATNDK
jgi:hypothetical protein